MRHRIFRFLSLIATASGLSACSQADLLNSLIPREGYTLHRNIAYGDNPRQVLDVYVPKQPAAGSPVIVFFYGGSWQSGSRADYRFAGQAFASKGFITVIADYRLYPKSISRPSWRTARKCFAGRTTTSTNTAATRIGCSLPGIRRVRLSPSRWRWIRITFARRGHAGMDPGHHRHQRAV